MRISTLFLRRLHKWVGLLLGAQLLLWTISGTAMALLDMETVAGGPERQASSSSVPASSAWERIRRKLGSRPVASVAVRPLLDLYVVEIATPGETLLYDAGNGRRILVDAALARRIATAAYPGGGSVTSVSQLRQITLEVREHDLPIWRIDFDDAQNSSFYVSGATGRLLERRNDSWRLWDFAWMLHNMDYANRTSFNHPLIIAVGFGIAWLALTGLLLLFRTAWRPDLNALRRHWAPRRP